MESIDKVRALARELYGRLKRCQRKLAPLAVEICNLADAIEAEVEGRYVALPVDIDGVPVRMGDVVRSADEGEPFEVREIRYRAGWDDEVGDGERRGGLAAGSCRHYEPPTVEGVLRELLDRCRHEPCAVSGGEESLVSEYARKLRLAEGE